MMKNHVLDGRGDHQHGDEHREPEPGVVGEAGAAQGRRDSTREPPRQAQHRDVQR